MPKFVLYDPKSPAPHPIQGGFDTDRLHYPKLPPSTRLVQLTNAQWDAYIKDHMGWAVQNGHLVPYDHPNHPNKLKDVRKKAPWLMGHEDLG